MLNHPRTVEVQEPSVAVFFESNLTGTQVQQVQQLEDELEWLNAQLLAWGESPTAGEQDSASPSVDLLWPMGL